MCLSASLQRVTGDFDDFLGLVTTLLRCCCFFGDPLSAVTMTFLEGSSTFLELLVLFLPWVILVVICISLARLSRSSSTWFFSRMGEPGGVSSIMIITLESGLFLLSAFWDSVLETEGFSFDDLCRELFFDMLLQKEEKKQIK